MERQAISIVTKDRTILAVAILISWAIPFFLYVPFDYGRWLGPWYAEILREGRVAVFAEPFANYSPPYLYLLSAVSLLDPLVSPFYALKILSVAGALWMFVAVRNLLIAAGSDRPFEGALWALLLPSTLLNVPLLGQADCFWAAPALFAVSAAMRRNYFKLVAWAGLAFAIKAQAVFIAPFVIAFLLRGRVPLWLWVVPPAVYILAMFPAWMVGWPFADLMTVYLRQVAWVPASGVPFVSNAANWWLIFRLVNEQAAIDSFAVGYGLAALATGLFSWKLRGDRSPLYVLLAASLSATMLPWLLPGMHERFFFLGEMLTFCLAWTVRKRATTLVAGLMQAGIVLAVIGWLTRTDAVAVAAFVVVTAALSILLHSFLRQSQA